MNVELDAQTGQRTFVVRYVRADQSDFHRLPKILPGLSKTQGEQAVALAPHWKTVHAQAEQLYSKYIEFQLAMSDLRLMLEMGIAGTAHYYRRHAENKLGELERNLKRFNDELRTLPVKLKRTKPIQHLQKIPTCLYAIQRNLVVPGRDGVELGYQMCEAIGHWLLEALHMADAILTIYLDSQNRQPPGGQTLRP